MMKRKKKRRRKTGRWSDSKLPTKSSIGLKTSGEFHCIQRFRYSDCVKLTWPAGVSELLTNCSFKVSELKILCCRMLLCTVVRIKMNMYDASNSRTQSAEEYLKAYLDSEVRQLWPQGWMQARSVRLRCSYLRTLLEEKTKWHKVVMMFVLSWQIAFTAECLFTGFWCCVLSGCCTKKAKLRTIPGRSEYCIQHKPW